MTIQFLVLLTQCVFVSVKLVTCEVITLTKGNNIICVLNGESVNSAVSLISKDKLINISNKKPIYTKLNDWEQSFDTEMFDSSFDQVSNLIGHSNRASFHKSVTMPFTRNTKEIHRSFLLANNISLTKSYLKLNNCKCILFDVSIDKNCLLLITTESYNETINEIKIEGFNEANTLKIWKNYKIQIDENNAMFLKFERKRKDNETIGFWAITDIRECDPKLTIYKETLPKSENVYNYICKSLKSTKSVISSVACNNSKYIGHHCNISCTAVLGTLYSNCEKHKICVEDNCFCSSGFKGPNCEEVSDSLYTKINNNGTITISWDEFHKKKFDKYELKFECTNFCPHLKYSSIELTSNTYTSAINSSCKIKLLIRIQNTSELIGTKQIDRKIFTIDNEELPKIIELSKDRILFTMEACDVFKGPLNYTAVLTCLDSWCKNKNSTAELLFKNYNKTITKEIKNLYSYTSYRVNVIANRAGQKYKQRTYNNIMTSASKPEQVRELFIYNIEENVMGLKWLADTPPKGKIEKYNISLINNTGFIIESSDIISPCKLWNNYTCGNLTIPEILENYNISVSGKNYNVTEWSKPSFLSGEIKNVTTPPRNLTAMLNTSSNTLSLSWEHPLYVYGRIYSFLVEINNKTFEKKITTYERKYFITIQVEYEQSYNISVWTKTGFNTLKSAIVVSSTFTTKQNLFALCSHESTCPQLNNNNMDFIKENSKTTNMPITSPPNLNEHLVQNSIIRRVIMVMIISTMTTLAVIILLGICYKQIKKKTSRQLKNNENTELSNISEDHSLVEINNENIADITQPIHMINLEQYIISSLENFNDNDIINQFKAVPKSKTTNCKVGLLVKNLHKNRYLNIIPYDDNRVILTDNGESDYINASYINSYKTPKALIATQAPLESTIHDFWQMVCQEKCEVIVMLNELEENGNMKSERYWPVQKSKFRYGKFLVENVATSVTSCCRHSNLIVKFDNIEHVVQHYQYMSWPEEEIPPNIKSFNNLLEEIITLSKKNPIIVHCNDGCGRTGVFILCYIMIEMAVKEKYVDYPKILKQIRNQRCYLIGNMKQYIFCYKALSAYIFERNFAIRISNNFQNEIEKVLNKKYLELLLMRLEIAKEQYINVELLLSEEDKLKNRFSKILPGQSQIVLPSSLTNSSNYINAITVDSYLYPGKFIVTQQPLPNTIADFWKLIEENEISIIISLNEIFKNDTLCPRFWPNKIKQAWDFTTTKLRFLNKDTKCDTYDVINVKIKRSENYEKTVSIVDLKIWKRETLKPPDPTHLIRLWKKYVANSQKIVVMCYDGATASGLFVALAYMLEEIDTKNICDIFHAVKSVREYRPQFIQDLEQLEFLYKAALIYITEITNKKNMEMYVQNNCL